MTEIVLKTLKHGQILKQDDVSFLFCYWECHFKKNSIVAKLVFTMKINIKMISLAEYVFFPFMSAKQMHVFFILLYIFFLTLVKGEAGVFTRWFKILFSFQLDLGVK